MKTLVEQLRTHSVWVVLGVYLAVSWVVLRVVDAISGNLTLPGWIFPFALGLLLLGLPIILATSIIQSGVPATDETSPEPIYTPGSDAANMRRLFTWRNTLVGAVGGFLALAVGTTAWVMSGSDAGLTAISGGRANASSSIRPPGDAGASGVAPTIADAAESASEAFRALALAIRSMDVEGTLAMYDDRPDFSYAFGSELVRGRAAFDARVREGFSALRRIDVWEIDELRATAIDAENVMIVARFREVAIDKAGTEEHLIGVATSHLVRRAGGWRIAFGHTSAEPVPDSRP